MPSSYRSHRGRSAPGVLVVALGLGSWAAAASAQLPPEQLGAEIDGLTPLSDVPVLETPAIDVAVASARAASAVSQSGPVPFAEPFAVEVTPTSHGRWESSSDARTAVWRLRVISAGAVSLNLGFGRYRMPPGGRLRVYTPRGDEVVGPYTDADNRPHGELWTPILSGGDIVIEAAVPAERLGELELRLEAVNRGFRDPVSVRSPSHSSCGVDVACPDGDAYRDQIRSVGLYTIQGIWRCTGALVNSAAEDSRLFFLTARHCFVNASREAPSVVAYWNYQRPACGVGTATRRDRQSGAVLRVKDRDSDLILLELDGEPDPAHELYLAGWDLGSAAPTSATVTHHPSRHYKSISAENDPLTRTRYRGHRTRPDGTYWRVDDWDSGTTENGSSGSPLFDQNKRVVGVLGGGAAACGNDEPDWRRRIRLQVPDDFTMPPTEGVVDVRRTGRLPVVTTNAYGEGKQAALTSAGASIDAVERLTLEDIFLTSVSVSGQTSS